MTRQPGHAKVQHYVPKMLLKNFTAGKKPKVWVYDKQKSVEYQTNIKNIAAENAFYDVEHEGEKFSLEPGLQALEGHCTRTFRLIIENESLAALTEEDRIAIATFVAVQKLRTAHVRKNLLHMDELMQGWLQERGIDPNEVANYRPLDQNSARLVSLQLIGDAKEFIPRFLEKEWVLLRGNSRNPFYISDNPVALQNMVDYSPRGSLGLSAPGIEIYLPVSSELTLAMYCRTLTGLVRENYRNHSDLKARAPALARILVRDPEYVEEMVRALSTGSSASCRDENIENLNYLQVRNAERHVYCEKCSFDLVRDMLSKDDQYKEGPRMRIN